MRITHPEAHRKAERIRRHMKAPSAAGAQNSAGSPAVNAGTEQSRDVTPEASKRIADLLLRTFDAGGTVYFCGCGGSTADAEHLAAELLGRCSRDRRPLPAVALTCSAVLTGIANDFGFKEVFRRQVRALASSRDLFVGLSTSGTSQAVLRGLDAAIDRVGVTGLLCSRRLPSSPLRGPLLRIEFDGTDAADVQQAYMAAWHDAIRQVEEAICAR